jgi:hypothetical protein
LPLLSENQLKIISNNLGYIEELNKKPMKNFPWLIFNFHGANHAAMISLREKKVCLE